MERIRIEQHTFMGTVWVAAWLFTIGFLHLSFWKGVLAQSASLPGVRSSALSDWRPGRDAATATFVFDALNKRGLDVMLMMPRTRLRSKGGESQHALFRALADHRLLILVRK